jgi:hypothetical protein
MRSADDRQIAFDVSDLDVVCGMGKRESGCGDSVDQTEDGQCAVLAEEETMKLFGQIVRTVVNVALLPVAVLKDVATLGGVCTKGDFEPYTAEQLKKIKDEAGEQK